MIFVYPFYVILLLSFTVLQWVTSPLLALCVNAEGHLPRYLRWFETFDASVDEGWLGGYYRLGWGGKWWARTKWLCRNPGYGFAAGPLGITFWEEDWEVWFKRAKNGRDMIFFAWGPALSFDLHFRWGILGGKFGWKAWNNFDEQRLGWKSREQGRWGSLPCCFSPQIKSLRK